MTGQTDLFDPARPGAEPVIMLEAYQGDLTHLVQLVHAREIDLTRLDIVGLIDQLAEAARAHAALPLGMKAQWVVMASGLLLLRSRLLLPADDPRQQQAAQEAQDLRARLIAAEQAGHLAGWLAARAQLGRDVHAFGGAQPAALQDESAAWEVDRIEFLWGCLAVFDGNWGAMPEQTPFYAPVQLDLFSVEEARVRVRACLARARRPVPLDRMLPDSVRHGAEGARRTGLRRSAWSSTFTACLEMVKQGEALAYQPSPDALPRFGNVAHDGPA